ncbi:hypothetical protein AB1N83_012272 [Pleurotus pulmonarius]
MQPIMSPFTTLVYRIVAGCEVTHEQLKECATLFSQNYGVWSVAAPSPLKPGARIKMSARSLKEQCLSDPTASVLALCVADGILIGHAFASLWSLHGETICWVTQLVVSSKHRQRGIATSLLSMLPECHVYGLASSHPAACLALCKRGRANIRKLDLVYIKEHAQGMLASTPIPYLKTAKVCGALFRDEDATAGLCTVCTSFFVDHDEPLAVLHAWQEYHDMPWVLGDLPEGNEYLCIIKNHASR